MAEFVEVLKQRERMCDSYDTIQGCINNCPLGNKDKMDEDNCTSVCRINIVSNPQEAEEIIMAWAKEHPIQTNADKFKEVFGIEPQMNKCPNSFCLKQNCEFCTGEKFWKAEYKEPKKV